jgi:hypothetical protein
MALESFDDALDPETVLWAVRGMNATRLGVSADDVAQFLAKDTTLSAHYDRDNVGVVLDSLTADGMLTYEPSTGEFAAIDGNVIVGDEIDLRSAGDEASPSTAFGEAVSEAFLRLRIEQLEHERNELGVQRDKWRARAESAAQDAKRARAAGEELRTRVHELERLLEEERAAEDERSDNTRRAARALARAQQELEGLRPDSGDGADDDRPTRSRRPLRGNWLA